MPLVTTLTSTYRKPRVKLKIAVFYSMDRAVPEESGEPGNVTEFDRESQPEARAVVLEAAWDTGDYTVIGEGHEGTARPDGVTWSRDIDSESAVEFNVELQPNTRDERPIRLNTRYKT